MVIEGLRILGRLIEPTEILSLLVLAGATAAVARRWRLAGLLQIGAALLVIFFDILPGGVWLALPLEKRFPVNPQLPQHVDGVIALGGTERLSQSKAWGQPTLSDPTPIAALLALGRRYPDATLIFTGGAAAARDRSFTESRVVRDFIDQVGAGNRRIIYEEKSRDTLQNALYTRDLINPKPSEHWILVTQAISMPRAVAVFRHAGWSVIPYPAGYLTDGKGSIFPGHMLDNLRVASVAVHEWGGLLAYRMLGYTQEAFPGPSE